MTTPRVLVALPCPVCGVRLRLLVARGDGQAGTATIEQRACAHRWTQEEDRAIRDAAVTRAERVGE